MEKHEIKVLIPPGFQLVGVKTDGDVVIIIYAHNKQIRQIGFIQPEPEEDDEEDPGDKTKENASK